MRIRSFRRFPFPAGTLSNILQKTWLLAIILGLSACGDNDRSVIRMTSRERAEIDTLYVREIKVLRPHWDSICKAQFDSLVAIAVDSIVLVRKKEEIRLRARIQENEQ